VDNDGDGRQDQGDFECISTCDDDEASFATGLPGDNKDCKQDCFFDGNSGAGDDGCEWDIRCDPNRTPQNGYTECLYSGTNACNGASPTVPQACLDVCEPNVPNGCDCFGCCTVDFNGSSIDIFLGDPTCSVADPGSCEVCVKQTNCGNPCQPDLCEVCFGQDPSDLPPGCSEPECPPGVESCTIDPDGVSNCGRNEFCQTGCCVPAVG
jgi:hypothetical protein